MVYYVKYMETKTNGFTVIELLIVITIIGILASVILPRLQNARDEGFDTKLKTDLVAIGKRAAIEESSSLTYDIVCGTGAYTQSIVIADMITNLQTFSDETVSCESRIGGYAVSVPLDAVTHWCVDSGGVSIERATALAASEYSCE